MSLNKIPVPPLLEVVKGNRYPDTSTRNASNGILVRSGTKLEHSFRDGISTIPVPGMHFFQCPGTRVPGTGPWYPDTRVPRIAEVSQGDVRPDFCLFVVLHFKSGANLFLSAS
eukprot:3709154-Rhodomonas_salina.1